MAISSALSQFIGRLVASSYSRGYGSDFSGRVKTVLLLSSDDLYKSSFETSKGYVKLKSGVKNIQCE